MSNTPKSNNVLRVSAGRHRTLLDAIKIFAPRRCVPVLIPVIEEWLDHMRVSVTYVMLYITQWPLTLFNTTTSPLCGAPRILFGTPSPVVNAREKF